MLLVIQPYLLLLLTRNIMGEGGIFLALERQPIYQKQKIKNKNKNFYVHIQYSVVQFFLNSLILILQYLFRYVLYFYHIFYLPLLILGFQFTIIFITTTTTTTIFFNLYLRIFSHCLGRMGRRKGKRKGGVERGRVEMSEGW